MDLLGWLWSNRISIVRANETETHSGDDEGSHKMNQRCFTPRGGQTCSAQRFKSTSSRILFLTCGCGSTHEDAVTVILFP